MTNFSQCRRLLAEDVEDDFVDVANMFDLCLFLSSSLFLLSCDKIFLLFSLVEWQIHTKLQQLSLTSHFPFKYLHFELNPEILCLPHCFIHFWLLLRLS